MATNPKTAKSIFLEAVEKYKPDQWQSYVDGACGDDVDLRIRVADLLKAHRESDSLLDQIDGTVDLPKGEVEPGTMIGDNKLLQQIGEDKDWQSHLIRDVRRFARLSKLMLAEQTSLARFCESR